MDARLIKKNGGMVFSINGEILPFTTFKLPENPNDELFERSLNNVAPHALACGLRVMFVPVWFDWPAHGVYDFAKVDRRARMVLEKIPNALLVIRIQATPMNPKWWLEQNPDAVLKYGCGRPPADPPALKFETFASPSLASDFWETDGVPALQALVRHVKAQDYAARVLGYLPTAYNSNEWFFRSYDPWRVCDFSPAMKTAFAAHVRATLGPDAETRVPDLFDRGRPDDNLLHPEQPVAGRAAVVEYHRYFNRLCAEKILAVTRGMRAAAGADRLIIGTFYGYLLGLACFPWLAESGHLALETLLTAKEGPDFLCSPLDYFVRNPLLGPGGGFTWSQSTMADSGYTLGKAYFGEDDTPPSLRRVEKHFIGAHTDTPDEDIAALRRNFAFALCKGQMQWWYDLGGIWYEPPERQKLLIDCHTIAGDAVRRNRRRTEQVAVVFDETLSFRQTLDLTLQHDQFWRSFFESFAGIGAPVDCILRSDLPRTDLSRYRAVFFINTISMNRAERAAAQKIKRGGRILVFTQAGGYLNPDAGPEYKLEHIAELTGMRIEPVPISRYQNITTLAGHPLLRGVEGQTYGEHREVVGTLCCQDEKAVTLGQLNGSKFAGLALKEQRGWTAVHSAVPLLPMQLIRNILDAAGVHRYVTANDVVYANESYLCLYCRSGGQRTVRLPEARKVSEVFSQRVYAKRAVKSFTFRPQNGRTYLFRLDK